MVLVNLLVDGSCDFLQVLSAMCSDADTWRQKNLVFCPSDGLTGDSWRNFLMHRSVITVGPCQVGFDRLSGLLHVEEERLKAFKGRERRQSMCGRKCSVLKMRKLVDARELMVYEVRGRT